MRAKLAGTKILITRAKTQGEEFQKAIRREGGEVILFPTIEITEPINWTACDQAIKNLKNYDALVFTSTNGVKFFLKRLEKFPASQVILKKVKIYTVGDKTKEFLEKNDLKATSPRNSFNARKLAKFLVEEDIKRVLFPRGNLSDNFLIEFARKRGIRIDPITVYHTVKPKIKKSEQIKIAGLIANHKLDIITFFSPSSVKNFLEIFSDFKQNNIKIAVIGNTTKKAAEELGLRVGITIKASTAEVLAKAVMKS